MDYERIEAIEPGKRSGKPCIIGMRITVSDILEYLAGGMTEMVHYVETSLVNRCPIAERLPLSNSVLAMTIPPIRPISQSHTARIKTNPYK
ncbi:MAG: DUF433 domain-containing protein [Chlorogloea purpurea SAG 13.99]|nr:DUF433 domain-containing protein [Chlorogloea purpurea SAG 13.99]